LTFKFSWTTQALLQGNFIANVYNFCSIINKNDDNYHKKHTKSKNNQ